MFRSSHASKAVVSSLLAVTLAACGEARSAEEEGIPIEAEAPPPPPAVEAGSLVTLSLQGSLSTEDEITGRAFSAVVNQNVTGSDGSVMIPAGAVVTGRVAEASQSRSSDMNAYIRLSAESVSIDGQSYPLSATVVEAAVDADAQDAVTETAAKVGVGAAAGAVLGKVIGGDTGDAVKGAVVGAAAGGVVAGVTRSGHAHMEEGARIVIRLDERLVVR